MIKLLTLICIVFFSVTLLAQPPKKYKPGIKTSELKEIKLDERETAKQAISVLKNGVLLVRLNFKQKEVAYFEEFKNTKEADRIRKQQLKLNLHIINAFNDLYNFSPIYFFGMENSRKVVDGNYSEITFYNNDGVADPSLKLESKNFLIAEFGMVETDTSNNQGATTSMNALVVRSNKFVQLRDPFPFYAGYSPMARAKKRFRMPVLRLDERLHNYYKEVNKAE